jgi:hypothetical protein
MEMNDAIRRELERDDTRVWAKIRRSMVLLLLAMGGIIWAMAKVIGLYMAGEDGTDTSLTALRDSSWGGMAGVGILACLAASCVYALAAATRSRGQLRSAGLAFFCVSGLVLAVWAMVFVECALGFNLLGLR